MATGLVTCTELLSALLGKLATATEQEKDLLKQRLGIAEYKLRDCDSNAIEHGDAVATCENLNAAVDEINTAIDAVKAAVADLDEATKQSLAKIVEDLTDALTAAVTALEAKQIHDFVLEDGELVITLADHTEYPVDVREVVCNLLPKQYYPTLQITLDDVVCGAKRVGWAYHPDDLRDPKADVQITDCNGNVMFWLYPTAAPSHNIPAFDDASNEAIGFYANAPVVAEDVCNPCGDD